MRLGPGPDPEPSGESGPGLSTRGVVSGALVTHERATVDEIAAAGVGEQRADVSFLLAEPGVEEAYVLRTCNRAEAYVVSEDPEEGDAALDAFVADVPESGVRRAGHGEALEHLLAVAAGLDSMVLGEDRVLGQVREAYEDARGAGGVGPLLEEAVPKAIHVGERVRTETDINEGVVSIASAAAEFLARRVEFEAATGVVVGAGRMGTAAAGALADRGIDRLVVVNRTVDRARAVAGSVADAGGPTTAEAAGLDALGDRLAEASLAVTATASDDPVLDADDADAAGDLVVADIAQPRDVAAAVANHDAVDVYDLDAMQAITERTRRRRRRAAENARDIVDEEFDRLREQFKRKRADEVIAAMHASADRLKRRQVGRALRKLEADGLTEDQREVVESMADALVGQLLAAPTKSLREAAAEDDWSTIATALQLFDPEFEERPDAGESGRAGEAAGSESGPGA